MTILSLNFKRSCCLKMVGFFFFTGVKMSHFSLALSGPKVSEKAEEKKGPTAEEYASDEINDEVLTSSQAASAASQDWISNHQKIIKGKLCPSINY